MPRPSRPRLALAAALPAVLAGAAGAQPAAPGGARGTAPAAAAPAPLDSATVATLRWRPIGPANMSGRITDIEVDPTDPRTYYVATAAGGIWKTVNHGTTFFPLFDRERVISLGDIAVAPSDPRVLYAGTGEEDSRNSISPGGGVYKSTDAGRTWQLVGLRETEAIGRVVVHPRDPNVVWVAALGHIWGPNRERGLYKTTDGGRTWQLKKFVSDKAGFVDIAMDPTNPDVLYASSWERVRGPYFLRSGGPGSALWKSTDGGETWREVRGGGFPEVAKGRIGLAVAPSDPQRVYAWVEADTAPNPRRGPARAVEPGEPVIGLGGTVPRAKTMSGIYRSADGGRTWAMTYKNEDDARPFYYSQVRVDPKNPDRIYWMSSVFRFSDDGGKTVRRGALSVHTDWHAMWINPADPNHFVLGGDGGVYTTWDRGGTYDFINTFPIGQFYAISYDMQTPYRVCGGLQDNGSWCGPSRTTFLRGATNANWFNVGGGDGFWTAQDPADPNTVYAESQGGNISRLDVASNARVMINRGGGRNRRSAFEDSMIVARGDTTLPETPTVTRELARLRRAARVDSAARLRFNWNTPFFLSPHNPRVVYAAGSRVLKSLDRGDHFHLISPDLSTKDSTRIRVSTFQTGGITPDNTGAELHGTVTALAESPIRPGILWAGTDDGNVWVSRNDGGAWEDLTGRFPGVPAKSWVSRVEPSAFDTAAVYVSFDNHRENDFAPYIYASSDFGRTFRRITGGIPTDRPNFVHVVREDPHNRDLLFAGTDVGVYVSADRGGSWRPFMTGLPTVPVHDLKIHPRERELIAGTHGRSIWVVDVAPLEQLTDSARRAPLAALAPKTAYQYSVGTVQEWAGNKLFQAENPPYGAELWYRVGGAPGANAAADGGAGGAGGAPNGASDGAAGGGADTSAAGQGAGRRAARDSARIVITDAVGDTVRVLAGPGGAGLHRVMWDLRGRPAPLSPAARRDSVRNAARDRAAADSARAALAADTSAAGRALHTLLAGAEADRRALIQRAQADTALRAAMTERGQALPAALRRQLMTAAGPLLRDPGARPGEPNLRPAEAPPGASGGGGGGGSGGQRRGTQVQPGRYVVTITANGQTARQTLVVERSSEVREVDFGGEEGER